MNHAPVRSFLQIFALCILFLSSCEKDENQITFEFIHRVGTETLEFDTIRYVNAYGNTFSVVTLKYFISNIILQKTDGGSLLIDEEHYIDASDNTTTSFIPLLKIPVGTYSRISFVFGLDTLKNVSGWFTNPPESKMEWPLGMGGGYHYLKLEGKLNATGLIKSYQAHMGQLKGMPYYISVDLPESSFNIDGDDVNIQIIMDINKWWVNPNTLDLNDITGIMGNGSIQQQLKENGNDVFSK